MKEGYKTEHKYFELINPSGVLLYNYKRLNEVCSYVIGYKMTDEEKNQQRGTSCIGFWNVKKLK